MRCRSAFFFALAVLAACSDKVSSGDGSGDDAGLGDTGMDGGSGDTSGDAGGDPDAAGDGGGDAGSDVESDVWTIDCEPAAPACTADSDCAELQICELGHCLDPVVPEEYIPAELFNVAALDFPAADALGGFDVDGNGTVDNLVGLLVTALPGGPERVEDEINRALDSGLLGLAVEVESHPETCGTVVNSTAADIAIHYATRDLNFDGVLTDDELSETPVIQLLPSGFSDDRGPQCLMGNGSIADDGTRLVGSGGVSCGLSFPLLDGTIVMLPVGGVQIEADLASVSTKDGERAPNGSVGGYVEVQAIVDEANRIAPSCSCAGVDTASPIAESVVEGGHVSASCIQDVSGAETCPDTACANLPALCASMGVLGLSADIATPGGGGVQDAVSFGFGVVIEPATTPEQPMAPSLVAVGDHYSTNRALQIGPAQTSLFVPVLANDQYVAGVDSIQTAGPISPDDGAYEFTITETGIAITVLVPLTDAETAEFSLPYTIGDGAERSSTANVTVLVSRRTPNPEINGDEFDAPRDDAGMTINVVENDYAVEGAVVVIGAVSGDYDYHTETGTFGESATTPGGATVTIDRATNTLTYVPGEANNDTFYYRAYAWSAEGGESESFVAAVYVSVDCPVGSYGYECLPCPVCDVGECLDGMYGSGECGCEYGYTLDGPVCVDIDECELNEYFCPEGYACSNTPGYYDCVLP
jgi:hypothetical protein